MFCLQGAVHDFCFVDAEQRVLGQMVKKRGLKLWRKVSVIAENAGVAFFADVRETLLELLPARAAVSASSPSMRVTNV